MITEIFWQNFLTPYLAIINWRRRKLPLYRSCLHLIICFGEPEKYFLLLKKFLSLQNKLSDVNKNYIDNGQKFELWELKKAQIFDLFHVRHQGVHWLYLWQPHLRLVTSSSHVFPRILNLRIYEFFSQNFIFYFLETCKVSFFCYDKQFYRHFWSQKTKILPCTKIKQRKFREIFL